MKTYLYPQNLRATANLWLWSLRDFAIMCVALLLSILILSQTGIVVPLALTLAFAQSAFQIQRFWILSNMRQSILCSHNRNSSGKREEDK